MTRKAKVLVVDDSAFARTTLARILRGAEDLEVIATARDGADALELIQEHDPDVVTLDLTMPVVDGLAVLRALAGRPRPHVIVVSKSGADTELGAEALTLGAIDIIAKPTALASDRLLEIGTDLIAKVRAASARFLAPPGAVPARDAPTLPPRGVELVVVGTSTGGPQALTQLLRALPGNLGAPLAMVLHIPIGYTAALAERLDKLSPLHVVEASDGLELVPGMAVLARAGAHLRVERSGGKLVARLAYTPAHQFMPSVDELFSSAAATCGAAVLGVVLTGMGDDGLAGARRLSETGATLVTESPATCIVYGMPRAVFEADLGAQSVPLDRIAAEIIRRS
jgi:two-component system chemotaxis response regulator CheB